MLARSPSSLPAFLVAVALVSLAPAPARADDGPGAFRVALALDVLGYAQETLPRSGHSDLFFLREEQTEHVRVGFLEPRIGLELSGVIDPMILVGVTGAFSYHEVEWGISTPRTHIGWLVAAWGELVLLPDEIARPFARVSVGAAGAEISSQAWPTLTEVQSMVALTAGAHVFATRELSIDPWLALAYRAGRRSTESHPSERTVNAVDVTLGVTVGLWIGGERVPAPAPGDRAEPD